MARDYGIPFHVLVQAPRALTRGADVPIEERPASELLTFRGHRLIESDSSNIAARYPSFDVTPGALITYLIGFDDVDTLETFRQKYQKREDPKAPMPKPRNRYLLIYGVPLKSQYPYLASALKAESCASILVPEMRTALWGARAVAPELARRQVPATVISDNMMGTLFAQGEICKLCLFYKGLTEDGPSAICGSLLAVRLARAHGVPIELFGGESQTETIVDGDVSTFLGASICPLGVLICPVNDEIVSWNMFKE
jgi:methylthioribose-1-phosphate isomerase